jgi:galactonate dehydratase
MVVAATSGLPAFASLPKIKITRVRAFLPPNPNPLFNQSDMVVIIETDKGIIGVGEADRRTSWNRPQGD